MRDFIFTKSGGGFGFAALTVGGTGAVGGHVRVFDALTGSELDAVGGHGTHVAGTVGSGAADADGDDLAGDDAGENGSGAIARR